MRKIMDCRDFPSASGCSLTIIGEEEELLRAAVEHAVSVHGEKDTQELREKLRGSFTEEPRYEGAQPQQQPSPPVH